MAGCIQNGNPDPSDYLQNEDADIFMLDGYIYSNAQGIDWVEETEYSIGEQIGEIEKQSTKSLGFRNGSANVLPVGTKIYETDSPITVAVVEGEEIPYLKQVEG
ncbi:hypothetical protein V1502_10485 [Bacillus sp. SCS-153A]|uniref:hypothetical protein n=1 Tax=Rossellomorea sedimentorum TaxID=3115294 RepID=UPI0039062BC7